MTNTYHPVHDLNNGILSLFSLCIVFIINPGPSQEYNYATEDQTEEYADPDTFN